MSVRRTVSATRLGSAFRLAEDILRRSGEENRRVAREITDERKRRIEWEGQLNQVFKSAFESEFSTPSYDVKLEDFERIDICLTRNGQIIAAIESKGMVSDDHTKRPPAFATSVGGIKRKLNKMVQADIDGIDEKLQRTGAVGSHYQIFIPIIYELYRQGGEHEWHVQKRPWTTQSSYKDVRKGLDGELKRWFKLRDNRFELIHGTSDPIELWDANQLWLEQSSAKYPEYTSLEAFVSFFAFGQYVEK